MTLRCHCGGSSRFASPRKKANENAPYPLYHYKQKVKHPLDAEGELNTDVDLTRHLDDLGELDGFLSGVLEVFDGEDLKAGLVDLESRGCG